MFSAVPRIADILDGLRFGFVGMQQARLLFMTDHYANALMGERRRRQRLIRFRLFPSQLETGSFSTHSFYQLTHVQSKRSVVLESSAMVMKSSAERSA